MADEEPRSILSRINFFAKRNAKHGPGVKDMSGDGEMHPFPIPLETYISAAGNIEKTPVTEFSWKYLRDITYTSDLLSLIVRTKINETFRNGVNIVERFKSKCLTCGREFEEEKLFCPYDDGEVALPDYNQWKTLNEFIQKMNRFDESLLMVMREVDFDVHVGDNGWLYLERAYDFGEDGKVTRDEVKGVIRFDANMMRLIMSRYGMGTSEMGMYTYFCPYHRQTVKEFAEKSEDYKCGECGRQLLAAWYCALTKAERLYYSPREIYHIKVYSASQGYGVPPLMACADRETEILTEHGWKLFKDLDNVEAVMTLNPDTGNIEYQVPAHHISYHYKGPMYKVTNTKVDMLVTPNHRVVAKDYRGRVFVEKAEDLAGHQYRIFKNGTWTGHEVATYEIGGSRWHGLNYADIEPVKVKMDDWLEFLGYFISEGNVCRHKARNGRKETVEGVQIAQYKSANPEKYEKMKACLTRLGFPFSEDGGKKFKVNSTQLARHMVTIGADKKSIEKHIPEEFMGLSTRQLSILFDALMLGDGCASNTYATISDKLAGQVQELLLKTSRAGDVFKRRQTSGFNPINIVSIRDKRKSQEYFINVSKSEVHKHSRDSWEEYDGMVYDVEVPKYHILYVRRNGKAYWTGNCFMKVNALLRMDKFVLEAYSLQRAPQELLILRGKRDSIHRAWEWLMQKARENPNMVYPLVLEGDDGSKSRVVEHETFSLKPIEWNWTDMRQEYRNVVAAVYGVQPIFASGAGSERGSGGLANEGLQIAVTSLTIKQEQHAWNSFLEFVSKQFGITDYNLILNPNEQEDELRDLDVEAKRLSIAQALTMMGYEVEAHTDAKGRLKFTYKERLPLQPGEEGYEEEQVGQAEEKEMPQLDNAMSPEADRRSQANESRRKDESAPNYGDQAVRRVDKANYTGRAQNPKRRMPRGDETADTNMVSGTTTFNIVEGGHAGGAG